MAGLLRAQNVARAAQLEVFDRNAETRAQVREFLERFEAFFSYVVQRLVLLDEQVAVGFFVPTSDPAAQLVQFSQSKVVGVVDQDRACLGDVDAVFDDGGRHQNVRHLRG